MHIHEATPRADRARHRTARGEPLEVVCFSTYVSDPLQQSARHRDVKRFLLALRGERFEGEARIPVGLEERRLGTANVNDSIDWFGEMVVRYLEWKAVRPPLALVPLPTSRATLASGAGPWTSLLAISVASNGLPEAEILDGLRWKRSFARDPARSLSTNELYENLVVTRRVSPRLPVVLIDHLFRSSAVLRASAARLEEQGALVLMAVCAGRTASTSSHDPFAVVSGELQPFRPGH